MKFNLIFGESYAGYFGSYLCWIRCSLIPTILSSEFYALFIQNLHGRYVFKVLFIKLLFKILNLLLNISSSWIRILKIMIM